MILGSLRQLRLRFCRTWVFSVTYRFSYVVRPVAGVKCSRCSRDGAEQTNKPQGLEGEFST